MPLDDTTRRIKPKPKPKPAPKPDANAVARAELDLTLAGLLSRAKTAKGRDVLAYWGSSLACSQAESWRGSAKKALIARGVLPDYTTNPLPVGTVETIYADPLVLLTVKVTQQASRLAVDAFVADLLEAGVKPALLKKLRKRHTTDFSGAHIITAVLTE